MKVIMYHYVRPKSKETNGKLRYLTLDQFNRQLDFFDRKYGFLSPNELRYNFENKIKTEKVLLTFDDGLLDHYKYVFPILKQREIKALFFVPTLIFNNNKILNVHKVHYLLSKYNSENIFNECLNFIKQEGIAIKRNKENEIYKHSAHEHFEYKVKRLFNYELNYDEGEYILEFMFKNYNITKEISKEIYLSKEHLFEMKKNGQIIGSHTESHQILSTLTRKNQKKEIQNSFNSLSGFYSPNFKVISYPYGYKFTYNDDTLSILKQEKVNFGFIFDNKVSSNFNEYEISREDCNKFIF